MMALRFNSRFGYSLICFKIRFKVEFFFALHFGSATVDRWLPDLDAYTEYHKMMRYTGTNKEFDIFLHLEMQ